VLAVVVPGFAAFGTHAGVALERAVAIGFEDHSGLVARRDLEFHGSIALRETIASGGAAGFAGIVVTKQKAQSTAKLVNICMSRFIRPPDER